MDLRKLEPRHRVSAGEAGAGVCRPPGAYQPRELAVPLSQPESCRLLRAGSAVLFSGPIQRGEVSHRSRTNSLKILNALWVYALPTVSST